jgi:hypothetical protein
LSNLLPYYGSAAMLYQAVTGQTLTGQELGTADRWLSGIVGVIPVGTVAYGKISEFVASRGASVGANSPTALQQATSLFSSNAPGTLRIGSTTFTEVPNAGNAAIFSGVTDAQVQRYFLELTGTMQMPAAKVIPGKGTLYVVNTPSGNFTLRDFSSSSGQTGPVWTIDIPKGSLGTTYNPEIKFLMGGSQ